MAVSIAQYVDLLFKKLQGVAKTANSTAKGASNESIASPPLLRGDVVWTESNQIANTAQVISGITTAYIAGNSVQCAPDTTVAPIGGIRPTWLTNQNYWIPQEFGSTWLPKVFVGPASAANIESTGTQIFAAGIGGVGEYFFDTQAGVLNFIGETIPTVLTAGNVVYVSGYTYSGLIGTTNLPGNTIIGNLIIANTTITTNQVDGNIVLEPTGNGVAIIDTVTGLVLPVGNTDQRPSAPDSGTVRFNTTILDLEIYDGSAWVGAGGGGGGNVFTITNQTISPDGSTLVFTLNQDATSDSVLLTINGVNQTPDVDYSVAGNSLTMSTVPLSSDLIQIRFLAGLLTNSSMRNAAGNAVISVTTAGNIDLQPSATNSVNVYGNIIPSANVTYNLGSTSRRWKDLWLSGSTITLGNIVIKNTSGNTISFYGPDGVTPATLDANAEIVADYISSGTSNVSIPIANGNVLMVAGGNTTLTITSTGANVTGTLNATGNATVGNFFVNPNKFIDVGNNIITNVATPLSSSDAATKDYVDGFVSSGITIQDDTANTTALDLDGTLQLFGTANEVIVAITNNDQITFGLPNNVTVTANLSAGNITTTGAISTTGNITGGNLLINTNAVITGNLSVLGTETIFNVANLTVNDKDIIVANNQSTAANVDGAGLQAGNPAVATWFFNNATTSWQSNVAVTPTSNGALSLGGTSNRWGSAYVTTLTATGNANVGNLGATNIVGTLTTASQTNITSVGTLGSLSVTGNITSGNLSGTSIVGTLTTASQTNITSVGTLSSLSVTGNVTGGNIITSGTTGILNVNSIEHTGSNGVGNIGSTTSYFNTVYATATSALYADLAEKYLSDTAYSPGTVLIFGGSAHVTACAQYADHRAAGVVSTAPAHLMNADLPGIAATVALAGQVPCKVIGPVAKGDVLTTSEVEGYAQVLDFHQFKPGCVIGKSLENCDAGPNVVLISVVR